MVPPFAVTLGAGDAHAQSPMRPNRTAAPRMLAPQAEYQHALDIVWGGLARKRPGVESSSEFQARCQSRIR